MMENGEVLSESVSTMSSKKLQNFHYNINLWSIPDNPKEVSDQFWPDWTDDFVQRTQHINVVFNDDSL